MAERIAQLYAEISADTTPLERGLTNVEKALTGTRTTILGLNEDVHAFGVNLGSTNSLLSGMGIALPTTYLQGFGQVLGGVIDFTKQAISETVAYGQQIRDLGAFAGITAEQSSKLIQTADDLGIEFSTLRTAARNLADQGLQPSVETLADLADEFKGIQDPVARSQFLMEKFGRVAPELAFALEQGGAAIRQLGLDAEATGLVVGEDFVQQTREAELALDNWEDTVMSVKVALATQLLPAVSDTVEGLANFVTLSRRVDEALAAGAMTAGDYAGTQELLRYGIITSGEALDDVNRKLAEHQAALEALSPDMQKVHRALASVTTQTELTGGAYDSMVDQAITANDNWVAAQQQAEADLTASLAAEQQAFSDLQLIIAGPMGEANQNFADQQATIRDRIGDVQGKIDELNTKTTLTAEQRTQLGEWQTELGDLQTELGLLGDKHTETTGRILFNMLTQRVAADGFQEGELEFLATIGEAWGIYDQDTATALARVDSALDVSKGNAASFLEVMGTVYDLPDDHITITTEFRSVYTAEGTPTFGTEGYEHGPNRDPIPNAHGGDWMVMGPTLFLAGEAGPERATFTPLGGGDEANDELLAVLLGLPAAVGRAVRDNLALAVR